MKHLSRFDIEAIADKYVQAYTYMQRKEIQRGDLFYYDFGKREGSVQSGERPVMVIQADNFNANVLNIGRRAYGQRCFSLQSLTRKA